METKWLEDFIALVDKGNFTRAAETRYITQPAFSRRIKALEDWLGVELVDRNVYPLKLTPLGREFSGRVQEVLGEIHQLRATMRERARNADRVVVATQHSLSVSFCPTWYASFRPYLHNSSIYIRTSTLYECVDLFLAKQCDLLLCYCDPQLANQLARSDLEHLELGEERLLPVCALDDEGKPLYGVHASGSVPVVTYPGESFFGDLIRTECLPAAPESVRFKVVYETTLSEGIRSLVLKGAGMGWLPAGIVRKELETGALVVIDELARIELKIMLYRHKLQRDRSVAEYWAHMQKSR